MTGEVIALGASYFGAAALFGLFMWRAFAKMFDSIEKRLDGLIKEHHDLARELSEFRGEMRGRFSPTDAQPGSTEVVGRRPLD